VQNGTVSNQPSRGTTRLGVCFVCTGNICRSPMADVVLRSLAGTTRLSDGSGLDDHLDITSAGTGGWHEGEPMDPRARAALERRGYGDHGHVAHKFDTARFESTDLVVCLDRGHQQTLLSLGRGRAGDDRFDDRLVMLRQFDPRAGGAVDVPDPYYGDDADFESSGWSSRGAGGWWTIWSFGSTAPTLRRADRVGPAGRVRPRCRACPARSSRPRRGTGPCRLRRTSRAAPSGATRGS
jgi:protein-tyrosine phosphatase